MVVLSELLPEGSSPSSSIHGHSSSTDGYRYDVFLSFRGVDTRYSFTDHLHKALIDAGINTFLDDEEIETGEDLKPELKSAIKASRASVIVLSKNYASSTWCLDELVLILEQRMTSNHIVIPIFYHVEPTHVRKQQSSFGDAMAKHKQTMEAETNANKRSQWAQKMDPWNKALIEVGNLKGNDVKGRLETKIIEEIVKDIHRRLHMHQLVQETGKFVVRQESVNKPWKRSRIWCHKESFKVLKQKKGKGNLLGLALDMRMLEKEKLGGSFELKTEALTIYNDLRRGKSWMNRA
ncbi:unnamed protein product [Lactuca virosa]|uniref:TIR domain-containing protein n=1 Tax=Lactuca virosa TaxID=75947 RepID=A0AAU9NSD4_9ASTR|nr:unnamed protein product [Lactuca virosa]